MIIVVCDANIIIDLLQVELFKSFLKLKWEKYVSPAVADEVQEDNTDQLIQAINSAKITLPSFDPADLLKIQELKVRYPSLSIEDKIITPLTANAKLIRLMKVNNRLPKTDCERLLKGWKKSL